jgi:hypothetical protein
MAKASDPGDSSIDPAGNRQLHRCADFFGVFRCFGLKVDQRMETPVRALATLATLGLCWWARRRCDLPRGMLVLWIYAFGYILLFNPRTENNTYVMFGPVVGLFAGLALFHRRQSLVGWALVIAALLTAAGHQVATRLTGQYDFWVGPVMTMVVLG